MKNTLNFRVIYKDTDAEGVVYYANYLGWFEAGRTELIRNLGISLIDLKNTENIVFAVKDIFCEYIKPALYDDELIVETEIIENKSASMIFEHHIIRKSDKVLLTKAKATLVALNIKTMKPARIPEKFLNKISK